MKDNIKKISEEDISDSIWIKSDFFDYMKELMYDDGSRDLNEDIEYIWNYDEEKEFGIDLSGIWKSDKKDE